MMLVKDKKIWGWALYDWANSAFATTVMAGFFPVFFKEYWSFGAQVNTSTARLGLGNALAGLLVALAAPLAGAMADRISGRKHFLAVLAGIGILATAGLYWTGKGNWEAAVVLYVLGCIGFSGSQVFYDALLPEVAAKPDLDRVSALGYALGYLGGGLLFVLNVLMSLHPGWFGLADTAAAVRFSFLTVALWWGFFTLFTLAWVKEKPAPFRPRLTLFRQSFQDLADTLRHIRSLKPLFLFLLAYWCYMDGVDTIVRMAVDYGMSIGFKSSDLITALIITQFVGFPAALAFGKLGQKWRVRNAIYLAIMVYMGVTVWGMFMDHKWEFYALAAIIGLVQGGIQALSRSYFARMIPPGQAAKFFGFYNMLGKFAVIAGPALVGLTGVAIRRALMPPFPTPEQAEAVGHLASRCSIGSLMIFFIVGGVLFYFSGRPGKPASFPGPTAN